MITFKNFLHETGNPQKVLPDNVLTAWSKQEVSSTDLSKLVLEHCTDWINDLKNGKLLYRGTKGDNSIASIIDSTDSKRMSKDSNNLYQLIMDESDSLKGVPSRSNSIIASTYIGVAMMYGGDNKFNTKLIIPYNGTEVAHIKYADMFGVSFESDILLYKEGVLSRSLNRYFMKTIGEQDLKKCQGLKEKFNKADFARKILFWDMYLNSCHGIDLSGMSEEIQSQYRTERITYERGVFNAEYEPESLKQILEYIQKHDYPITSSAVMKKFVQVLKSSSDHFKAISSELATKDKMGIIVEPIGSLSTGTNNECWFRGKCLSVRIDYVNDLIRDLQKVTRQDFGIEPFHF